MTRLSEHFTLEELTTSRVAQRHGLDNTPPPESLPLVRAFADEVLQRIRDRWGPIRITSGYRSPAVNGHPEVNGDPKSHHVWTAEHVAADIQPVRAGLAEVFDWIRLESGLPFDLVILEYGRIPDAEYDDCIHISYVRSATANAARGGPHRVKPRRLARIGATNNRSGYQAVEVA